MTTHPEEGTLQAYMDGELAGSDEAQLSTHLAGCAECRSRMDELGRLAFSVTAALGATDAPVDTDAARWSHRVRRADRRRGGRFPGFSGAGSEGQRRGLAAAAVAFLVVSTGLAAAIPGSPIRGWWENRLTDTPPAPAAAAVDLESTGVFTELRDGAMELDLVNLAATQAVEVQVVEGNRVGVFAPVGSSFDTGAGRVGVVVGSAEGAVRIELPAATRSGAIYLNGVLRLRKTAAGLFLADGSPAEPAEGVVRLSPSSPDNPSPSGG